METKSGSELNEDFIKSVVRADGRCECNICNKEYRLHPHIISTGVLKFYVTELL